MSIKIVIVSMIILCIFIFLENVMFKAKGIDIIDILTKQKEKVLANEKVDAFIKEKQIYLIKFGADIFIKKEITVGQYYGMRVVCGILLSFICKVIGAIALAKPFEHLLSVIGFVIGFGFLEIYLRLKNKASNDEMLPDIIEMNRSILYGKRGGQYISEALKDAVFVVENKRLKMALISLAKDIDGGINLMSALENFKLRFSSGEIESFCTVIASLQTTGQVSDSLKTIEDNIERAQVSVNKRRAVMLENKMMAYILLIAFQILAIILYCVIVKLLQMQIAF